MKQDKARQQAFLLLDEITSKHKYSNLTVKYGLDGFDARDRAFITALVYGTLDKMIHLDYVLSLYAKGRLQPKVRNLLRLGAYQILYMDRIPDSAAVDSSVTLAETIGKGMLKGYINGVLRTVSREKENIPYPEETAARISVQYSYPEFLVREMILEHGAARTEEMCAFEGEHRTCLRVNTEKIGISEFKEKLALPWKNGKYFDDCVYIEGEPCFLEEGLCCVQGEASMAVVRALAPQRGERILDCCAAPGGKTVYIAQRMQQGSIVALDKHEHRVKLIESNVQRCGVADRVEARVADMTQEQHLGSFDRVLADVPCSGLGVVEQKPEIKNTVTPQNLAELEKVQTQILENASRCVRPGGILVYSTCTVRKAENEEIIKRFLAAHPEFILDSLKGDLGEKLEQGRKAERGFLQFYLERDGIDGFFIARMKRI
jgi:ribosomal RNA small subunit methyltransferase B